MMILSVILAPVFMVAALLVVAVDVVRTFVRWL